MSEARPDIPQVRRAPLFRNRHKRFWLVLIVVVAVVVFYLPSLVAFRYTAAAQSTGFLIHPWRSWSFIVTALTVPGDSRLKTSGNALRAADRRFRGSAIDPHEVRLLFLPEGKPYTFTHPLGDRTVTTTITPPYRFVWQVSGHIDTLNGPDTVVALAQPVRIGDYVTIDEWEGTVEEVRLLFLPEGKPYTFTHPLGDRTVTTTITPPYRFVWQVSGHIDTLNGPDTVVAMLDYRTGKMLYDVRDDLSRSQGATEPGTPSAEPSPGGTSTSTSPSPTP